MFAFEWVYFCEISEEERRGRKKGVRERERVSK